MRASVLSFQAAVIFVVAGMIWGLVMAISVDHTTLPAHAHLNLLGWVSLFLFGIYYRLHPWLEGAISAIVQVWVWIVGTIILSIGVALAYTGHVVGDPVAAVGSIIVSFSICCCSAGWYFGASVQRPVFNPRPRRRGSARVGSARERVGSFDRPFHQCGLPTYRPIAACLAMTDSTRAM